MIYEEELPLSIMLQGLWISQLFFILVSLLHYICNENDIAQFHALRSYPIINMHASFCRKTLSPFLLLLFTQKATIKKKKLILSEKNLTSLIFLTTKSLLLILFIYLANDNLCIIVSSLKSWLILVFLVLQAQTWYPWITLGVEEPYT
jgi:hypothetical protein